MKHSFNFKLILNLVQGGGITNYQHQMQRWKLIDLSKTCQIPVKDLSKACERPV